MVMLATRSSDAIPTRVEDYLDDKFQTSADLENIDLLLQRVQQQQALLEKQLLEAQEVRLESHTVVEDHSRTLQHRTAEFQQQQRDLDRRFAVLTQSEASDDAVHKFEQRMVKVRRLEIATGYMEILKETGDLAHVARNTVKSSPDDAVQAYSELRQLGDGLQVMQPEAEGAAPHLIDHVQQTIKALYEELQNETTVQYQRTLDQMAWPKRDMMLRGEILNSWRKETQQLLRLQEPDLQELARNQSADMSLKPPILLPMSIMANPLVQRFRYHFYGDRPTNRLDKPEYFFSHILDVIEQHSMFLTNMVQPILDARIEMSDELEGVYTDAISAFINALLPVLKAKCLSLLPQLSSQPQLLSHLVHEMMSFDRTLRDSWAYQPVPGLQFEWKGLTWDILNTHGYFNVWLNVEKDFALTRYKHIRDAPDSNTIDYDGVEGNKTKPTKGAIRVNDLLETITDRYRSLSSFSQKMKFLIEIQISIFDDYYSHLHGVLQAYLVSSHTAGRLIQGQSEAEAVGMKGLESLAKIFGSAEYLEKKMSDWSDDLFFLELWDELQDRARRNSDQNSALGRELTIEDVAAKTSTSIKNGVNSNDEEDGALFDETKRSYSRLKERSEAEIVRALEINSRNALRPMGKVSIWASLSISTTDPTLLAPTPALDSLQQTLSTLLGFLSKVLGPAPLRRVIKQLCSMIQKDIYDNVLMRNSFSTAGAAQLRRDIAAIAESINASIEIPGEAQRHFMHIEEALLLLSLPIKASESEERDDNLEDDEWGFGDDNERKDEYEGQPDANTTAIGLWQAEKAIFASNQSARKLLAALQLETLTESDARNIIKRRVEVNS